jgi:peptidoglycan hydrolase-like protein with peptidoglycan-binding domain
MKFSLIAAAVAAAMLSLGAVAQEKKQDSQGAQSPSSTTQEQKPGSSATGSASGTTSGSAASGASSPSASGDKQSRQSQASGDEKIKQVQQKLKDQGHEVGPIDGIMGSKTQAGLKEFQSAKGLKATGQLDRETMAALGVSGSAAAGGSSEKKQ